MPSGDSVGDVRYLVGLSAVSSRVSSRVHGLVADWVGAVCFLVGLGPGWCRLGDYC